MTSPLGSDHTEEILQAVLVQPVGKEVPEAMVLTQGRPQLKKGIDGQLPSLKARRAPCT